MNALDLTDLLTRPERPCPELEACLYQDTTLGWTIKHPLVVDIFVDPEHCARQNAMLAAKRERIQSALAAGDWATYLTMHERPFRFRALSELIRGGLDKQAAGKALAWTWCDTENLYENTKGWRRLWGSRVLPKDAVMEPGEFAMYQSLPATVTVWRGYRQPVSRLGLSWTLSPDIALWFARRYMTVAEAGFIACAHVPVSSVAAVFLRRNEQEAVVPDMPRDVRLSLRRV